MNRDLIVKVKQQKCSNKIGKSPKFINPALQFKTLENFAFGIGKSKKKIVEPLLTKIELKLSMHRWIVKKSNG